MIGGRHAACPDPDSRCQHGDDLNCPALLNCVACFGYGCEPNTHGRRVCAECGGKGTVAVTSTATNNK